MQDPEMPVRFTAGSSFRFVLDNNAVRPVLQPILPALLDTFFSLIGELGVGEVMQGCAVT
jgi:hypothetical protein